MEYETNILAESTQKTTESDTEEANPGEQYLIDTIFVMLCY